MGPTSRQSFDSRYCLTRGDLKFKNGFWTVQIRWTKTIQTMNKIITAPLVPVPKCRQICPQHWITRMIKLIPAKNSEPLFLVREKTNRWPLSYGQISRLLGKWCLKAGLDPHQYTPHCLRRGGLNWAHRARVTCEALQIMGDWASAAYLRYVDLDLESRLESGEKMMEYASKLHI